MMRFTSRFFSARTASAVFRIVLHRRESPVVNLVDHLRGYMAVTLVISQQFGKLLVEPHDLALLPHHLDGGTARHDFQFRKFTADLFDVGIGEAVKLHRVDPFEKNYFFGHPRTGFRTGS